MKNLLWILLMVFSLDSFSQNFKKILQPVEVDSLSRGYKIFKTVDKELAKEFDGFEGRVVIYKIDNKIWCDFLDKSQRFDNDRNIIAEFVYDSIGIIKTYKEFNSKGQIEYDCVYNYKKINGFTYRLEHLKVYYKPNVLWHEGYRYLKVRDKAGKFIPSTSQRRYGKWIYYSPDGQVEKIKDYGTLGKVLPPTSAKSVTSPQTHKANASGLGIA